MFTKFPHHTLLLGASLSLGLVACKDKDKTDSKNAGPKLFASQDILKFSDIEGLSSQTSTIREDLQDLFCIHVYNLPLKSNFDYEFGYLCENNKPTSLFTTIGQHAQIVGAQPRAVELSLEHKEGGISEGTYVTVYHLPNEPKWVKTSHIQDYMTTDTQYDYLKMDAEVSKDLNDLVGGDLQFSKYNLRYVTEVTTPDNTSFSNERTTELNSYQVYGGNSDMGLGAEHLVESPEGKYKTYNTITLTIGDKQGGAHLITIIHIAVANNGYPETTQKVMSDLATAQATHVHDGIYAELVNYRTPE